MSGPTYRVELTHHPEMPTRPWRAEIHRIADDEYLGEQWGESRQVAAELAGAWVWRRAHAEDPSTVMLSEDGDLLDPHEVQR